MKQHNSWFEYNLTRPFPFRWFTPVVIVGGILAAVLFSVINFATNGHDLTTIYVTNPNTTEESKQWFQHRPWSWDGSEKSKCESQNIPIGSTLFTSNLGLTYTLGKVWKYEDNSTNVVSLPSLAYLNQPLEACSVNKIDLFLRKVDQSKANQSHWYSWDDSSATSTLNCTVQTSNGTIHIGLSARYNAGPTDYTYVISDNPQNHASTWWGTRALNAYWNAVLYAMEGIPDFGVPWTKGHIAFSPLDTRDIKDTNNFFGLGYYFISQNGTIQNNISFPLSQWYNNATNIYSPTMTEALSWARVMYSLLLVDLGQMRQPNVLLDEDLLQYVLQYPDDIFRRDPEHILSNTGQYWWWGDWKYYNAFTAPWLAPTDANPTLLNETYDTFKARMGPLNTTTATLFSQYACSVPIRKDPGSLFVSIIIADLVLLQALYQILIFITSQAMSTRERKAAEKIYGYDDGYHEMSSQISEEHLITRKPIETRATV